MSGWRCDTAAQPGHRSAAQRRHRQPDQVGGRAGLLPLPVALGQRAQLTLQRLGVLAAQGQGKVAVSHGGCPRGQQRFEERAGRVRRTVHVDAPASRVAARVPQLPFRLTPLVGELETHHQALNAGTVVDEGQAPQPAHGGLGGGQGFRVRHALEEAHPAGPGAQGRQEGRVEALHVPQEAQAQSRLSTLWKRVPS